MGAVPKKYVLCHGRPTIFRRNLCSFDAVQQFLTPQNYKGTRKWESYPHVHVPVFQLWLASRGVESNISMMCITYCIYTNLNLYTIVLLYH